MLEVDWTLIPAVGVFLLAVLTLNALLFKPLFQVMDERQAKTSGLKQSAQEILQRYEESFEEYESELGEARRRGYKQAEEARQEALKERSGKLSEARSRAEELRLKARQEIQKEVSASKQNLQSEVEALSEMIASRVLRKSA
ncbi:MAG TPA: hypothetical protein VLV83_03590 [Acidobacteriota bacterium]|nr:hypothetical protein [Acidobacteriota bacterium]